MKLASCLLFSWVFSAAAFGQNVEGNSDANPFGNALIPDLVADPSMVEFDGVFYCYATTDGEGKQLSTAGLPVVWKSRDFITFTDISKDISLPPGTKHGAAMEVPATLLDALRAHYP